MDIQAYISSGTLEAYVLGSLSAKEAAEVQANMERYPEVAAEVKSIESAMIGFAQSQAVDPPPGLQDKIWNAINAAPAAKPSANIPPAQPKTIPMNPEYRKPAQWKYAAMIALLLGSVALNLILWSQGLSERDDRVALGAKVDQMQAIQNQLIGQLTHYEKATTMMADTGMQTIVMHTVVQGHPMAATVYWGKAKGDAYVAMEALPQPPKGMQYQLWVIQGGKPVSMGILPNDLANTPVMQKVNMQVMSGEAFAISLEKEGGNATPTTVYVMGKA